MSTIWLRAATALYACGLLYSLLALFRKDARLFPAAFATFVVGTVLHLVSIVELGIEIRQFPVSNFYETSSLCAFLIALFFLIAYGMYRVSTFSICIFPLVFFMTLIGAMEFPVASWSNLQLRDAWLLIHIVAILIGLAAASIAAVSAVFYLLQENQLKRKEPRTFFDRLPPLDTLDLLVTRTMNAGFVFVTIGTVTGITWAFVEAGAGWITYPRITFSLITWTFYLALVYLRTAAGLRGRRAAWMALAVIGCSVLTWVTHLV